MKILALLRTIVSYFLGVIITVIYVLPTIVIALLPEKYRRDNKFFYFWTYMFYRGMLWATFLPYKVVGKQNLPKEPAIFVGNHLSALDIPVLGALTKGYPHLWLVLQFYECKPVLGFFIKRMNVSVDQSSKAKSARSLIKILRLLQGKNRHLLIFPEGGRSRDEKIKDFFGGFAIIAQKTGRPVIPVFMPNNGRIYPPHSFLVNYYPIDVVIGSPMILRENESLEEFSQRVKKWFLEQSKG